MYVAYKDPSIILTSIGVVILPDYQFYRLELLHWIFHDHIIIYDAFLNLLLR